MTTPCDPAALLQHQCQLRTHQLSSPPHRLSGHTRVETLLQLLLVEVLADEDHPHPLLPILPGLLCGPELDLLVHTVEHKLHRTLLELDDALGAEEVVFLGGDQVRHEAVELLLVQLPVHLDADGADAGDVRRALRLLLIRLRLVTVPVPVTVLVTPLVTAPSLAAAPVLVRVAVAVPVVRRLLLLLLQLLEQVAHVVQAEAADAKELVEVHARALALHNGGDGVDGAQRLAHGLLLLLRHQVDLVQQNPVRKRHLVNGLVDDARLPDLVQVLLDVLGVDHAEDRVDAELRPNLGAGVEGEGDGRRVGHACRLDDDGVVFLVALGEGDEGAHEVAAHRAAHAPVVHRDHVLLRLEIRRDEAGVDVHGPELVLHHRNLLPVPLRQDVVDQRRLP
mmetsp:Transcript_36657/g.86209  ORF Transcript_36657/g.86209 Transcript_36657/m.86209 type:complete len:393 (-) Transcript_36657:542-1720(-)